MISNIRTATVLSHAKVNLSLDILGTRADGFHALESVMQSISLHDTIALQLDDGHGIRVSCDTPEIPTDERNLVWKAASSLFESLGISPSVHIHIEKRIPSEAGLGGGSSNAAAVLRGLNGLLGNPIGPARLSDLAAGIGSDVPFFLLGGTAFVSGRGEIVEPLPDIRPWWMVIVKPPFGVSTAWAYRRLDEMPHSKIIDQPETNSVRLRVCIEEEACKRLPQLLRNDLEKPAVEKHPEIAEIKTRLLETGGRGALMSGSGSSIFGLFESEETARQAAKTLADKGTVFAARTISREEDGGECCCP